MESTTELTTTLARLEVLEPAQQAELIRDLVPRSSSAGHLMHALRDRKWLTPFQIGRLEAGQPEALRIGRYVLLAEIGEGGMGKIYKAIDTTDRKVVCLKVIRQELAESQKLLRRFEREREAASRLSHPNIVAAYETGAERNALYYAMEYVPGCDLGRWVQERGPLDFRSACEFMRQSALGLQHAHDAALIHRDIKPDNLLLDPATNQVKILDLGLCRVEPGAEGDGGATALTVRGTAIGTPEYMAPEQIRDSTSVDARSDLYALGCTFYYLITGRDPFVGKTPMEVMYMQVGQEPKPVEDLRPDTPTAVAWAIRKLMAKKREDRFQSGAELAAYLGELLKTDPGAWNKIPQPSASSPSKQVGRSSSSLPRTQPSSGPGLPHDAVPPTRSTRTGASTRSMQAARTAPPSRTFGWETTIVLVSVVLALLAGAAWYLWPT